MKRKLRRKTEITGIELFNSNDPGAIVTIALARTDNGVGFMAFTIRSRLEPEADRSLATRVLKGRLRKALNQYRRGKRVNVKLTTLIPARSM